LTIIFTLIISFIGFFAVVTCVALYYYKRGPRHFERLERIHQAIEDREIFALWSERPIIWEVWVDKYPKPTSQWNGLLPLNLTYDRDQLSARAPSPHQAPVLPSPRSKGAGWRSLGGAPELQLRESNDGQRVKPDTTDCKVSVLIVMPTPTKCPPVELGGEYAIGTVEVRYRHPARPRS